MYYENTNKKAIFFQNTEFFTNLRKFKLFGNKKFCKNNTLFYLNRCNLLKKKKYKVKEDEYLDSFVNNCLKSIKH